MDRLGQRLRSLREEHGYTLRSLAEKTGLSFTQIHQREIGSIRIKPPDIRVFAKAFGITPEEFRGERPMGPRMPVDGAIPVINSAPAGLIDDYEEWGTDSGQGYTTIDRGTVEDKLAFAVIVKGESMEPTLREGDTVVFSPVDEGQESRLRDGVIVFVRFGGDLAARRGCTIARLFWTDPVSGAFRLAKDNPRYPEVRGTLSSDEVSRISVGVEMRRRM